MKAVTYTRSAINAMRKIPQKDREAIRDKITATANGRIQDVKGLKGSNYSRLCHGVWRAIFEETDAEIAVLNVGKRGDVYK